MTDSGANWDRVERLIGKDNLNLLSQKKIGVIGLGSGGGFVALSLAMSGVGHFVLIDDDTLDAVNVVRHVADQRYIGQSKVAAVADLILNRNPKAEVETRIGRIEQHLDALDGVDLVVVGVDGENAKYVINQACLRLNLTATYAGVYERGEGGDVTVIRPYDGPCYACWAETLREGMSTGPVEELDYGMIGPGGTLEAEPGLWLHVVRVASAQADLSLNELMRATSAYKVPPGNTLIMANEQLEIMEGEVNLPHTAVWMNVERNPDCLVCGDAVRLRATDTQEGVSLSDLAGTSGMAIEEENGDEAE
jgi:molybdopterin/thiamine biosynthesis adenylyltransferase